MKNRIDQLMERKSRDILSVYFTAGYPALDDTTAIMENLEKNGVDMIEIGMPFSDPTADGPTIQQSSDVALKNGMSVGKLFEQLADIRKTVRIPLVLMGYFNPVLQFGIEKFSQLCSQTGIDGIIIPDMPLDEYQKHYRKFFEPRGIHNILLITPQTSTERILDIDRNSGGFIYMVSSSSTTGAGKKAEDFHTEYFERVQQLNLRNPRLIGFGISDRATFENACRYAGGAILGSAFIRALSQPGSLDENIRDFVMSIRQDPSSSSLSG